MPFAGSICWMAPEVVEGTGYTHVRIESNLADHQHHPHRCDEKADVWSFGIMVLELLQGSCPGLDLPTSRVLMRTLHEDVTDTLLPEGLLVSKALRDALQRCLVKDPAERTSAARLLEHRFWVKVIFLPIVNAGRMLSPGPNNTGVAGPRVRQAHPAAWAA